MLQVAAFNHQNSFLLLYVTSLIYLLINFSSNVFITQYLCKWFKIDGSFQLICTEEIKNLVHSTIKFVLICSFFKKVSLPKDEGLYVTDKVSIPALLL